MIVRISRLPIAPAATRACSAAKLGSNRLLKPTMSVAFRLSTTSRQRLMRSALRSIGFSQKIALPAFAARSIRSACRSVGVPMMTASISLAWRRRRRSPPTFAPVASASAFAAALSGSAIRTTWLSLLRRDVARMDFADAAGPENCELHFSLMAIWRFLRPHRAKQNIRSILTLE